jgi:hypothetical protein
MVRGTRQDVAFQTEPRNAIVRVDGEAHSGPVILNLKRKQVYQVRVEAEGCRPVEFELKARWDGLSFPSLLLPLGSLMTATDAATGADRAFPKLDTVVLKPAVAAAQKPVLLREYFGSLLTEQEYAQAVQKPRDEAGMDWRIF